MATQSILCSLKNKQSKQLKQVNCTLFKNHMSLEKIFICDMYCFSFAVSLKNIANSTDILYGMNKFCERSQSSELHYSHSKADD